MSFTKEIIYNLAFSALLLSDEVIEISTTLNNNSVNILNKFWDIAFESTLQDLDLDSLSQPITLELIEEISDSTIPWDYAYKYPTNCILLRRLVSGAVTDNRTSHISKKTCIYDGQKAILTNEYAAIAECIPKDVPLSAINPMGGLAIAYKLADLSAPLLVGKGAKKLRESIKAEYILYKLESQETDSLENFNYEDDGLRSEFVETRIS